jgi:Glycosyl hydrolases family 31 TIM-barrel domain
MSNLTLRKADSKIIITSQNYEVTIIPERLLVIVRKGAEFYYGMCMVSAIDMPGQKDKSVAPPKIVIKNSTSSEIAIDLIADSNLWEQKIHHYIFKDKSIEYSTEIHGKGQVERAYYFRGIVEDNELASVPGFTQVFSPQANFIEKQEFHVNEYHAIGAGNYKEVCDTVWGFSLHGGPLCFVCHEGEDSPFMSAGILAKPGEYSFRAFEINYLSEQDKHDIQDSIVGTEAFSLAYDGHLQVDGSWETPKLLLRFSNDRTNALKRYLNDLKVYGGTVLRNYPYEKWTYDPVFCTWHEQVALGMKGMQTSNLSFQQAEGGAGFGDKITQTNCQKWLAMLEAHEIKPGTIILDAKWQKNVGDPIVDENKFPDLRGFVDECHSNGIKVILWHHGWDREGVPDNECAWLDGKPAYVDPTNPAYRKRVRNYMRRLFSDEPGCYNADGFKVDGMTGSPIDVSLKNKGGLYGFEFVRALLDLLYNESKAVKPASALGQYTAFPYFADFCDFARTGDLYTVKGDPNSTNRFRAMLQELVMPGIAIDTDGALRFNYILPDEDVLINQENIGVPCVYQAEHLVQRRNLCIQSIQLMNDDKYNMIKKSWNRYLKQINIR